MDLNQGKRVALVASPKAGDQAAPVESPEWLSTNEASVTLTELTPDDRARKGVADDAHARWANGIAPGDAEVQFKADPQIGEGVKELIGRLAVTVTPREASAVDVGALGDEEDIPAA